MAHAEGRLVGGRYQLIEPIGRGGMGIVWRAHDELLDRTVAVKEVRYDSAMGDQLDELNRRTMREARAAGRLTHPNVVVVHDVIEEDDRPWIIMQLVQSRSLGQVIREDGRLSPERTTEIGLQVLDALKEAHAQGVLHRDVKPENVLITDDGRVVLTDFGIARLEADSTMTRTGLIGTPAFIAPERLRGDAAQRESDLWSLGATLYAAVEGKPPHDRGMPMATMHAVLNEAPAPAVHAGELRVVLERLLDKDPAARPGYDETAELLRRSLTGTARPKPGATPSSRASAPPASPAPRSAEPREAGDAGESARPIPETGQSAWDGPAREGRAGGEARRRPYEQPRAAARFSEHDTQPELARPPLAQPEPERPGGSAAARPGSGKPGAGTGPTSAKGSGTGSGAGSAAGSGSGSAAESRAGSGAESGAGSGAAGSAAGGASSAAKPETGTAGPASATAKFGVEKPGSGTGTPTTTPTSPGTGGAAGSGAGRASSGAAKPGAGTTRPETDAAGSSSGTPTAYSARRPGGAIDLSGDGPLDRFFSAEHKEAVPAGQSGGGQEATQLSASWGNDPAAPARSRPVPLLRAALVIVPALLIVAGVAGFIGLRQGEQDPPAVGGAARNSSAPGQDHTSAKPSGSASPSQSTSSPSPSPSPSETAEIPKGWKRYKDKTGFSIALPKGWKEYKRDGGSVWFRGSDRSQYLLIGMTSSPKDDAVKDWKSQEKSAPSRFGGYELIDIRRVDYFKEAADWEFTWRTWSGKAHVINRGFVTDKRHGYAIYWHTQDKRWKKEYHYFETFTATFKPAK
ncbi:serine/threonine-protein kinase [Microtetraspora glauca]|uniref:non-specific serine/threonine protein kinase n=1 Tax=Microtetraspora glauca TaxID=1996 RepID=A0ABV3GAG0_MICGL